MCRGGVCRGEVCRGEVWGVSQLQSVAMKMCFLMKTLLGADV